MKITKWMFGCAIILMVLGISCSEKVAEDPTTINVWTYYNGISKKAFDNLVTEFNATLGKEENIIVNAYSHSNVNQLADAVLASANEEIGSQDMPDIFAAYSDTAYAIDKMGMVMDLDSYFTEDELASYPLDFLEDGRFGADNGLKIMPIAKSSEILFVNKTDFDIFSNETGANINEFGTWESLVGLAKKYYEWTDSKTDVLNDGKALFGIDSLANYMIVGAKQLGEDIYDITDDGVDIVLSRQTVKKLWENFYIPFINGYYGTIGRFRSDDAKTGDILAYVGSTVSAAYFPTQIETSKDAAYPIECMTFPFPVFETGTPVAVQQGAGMVVVKSDEARQEAAVTFLKWFTAVEQNSQFAVETGYLPVKSEALHIDAFTASAKEVFGDSLNPLVLTAANTTYSIFTTYSMYAHKPFAASYTARKILENSLITFAKSDLEKINTEILNGNTKEDTVAKYTVNENFNTWYTQFLVELKHAVAK